MRGSAAPKARSSPSISSLEKILAAAASHDGKAYHRSTLPSLIHSPRPGLPGAFCPLLGTTPCLESKFPGNFLGALSRRKRLEDPRVSGQGDPAPVWGRDPQGQGDGERRRGGEDLRGARRPVCRQGADPRRRTRQGRRRQARQVPRGGRASTRARSSGMQLVTHQTGPEGQLVRKVLIEETADIAQELYVSITLDRAQGKPVIMASAAGRHGHRGGRREGPARRSSA